MSNLENLKQTLADEAAAQAADIRATAERQAQAIRAEAEAKAHKLREEAREAAQREIELRRRQAAAEERLLARQAVLSAKAELVKRAIEKAREKLGELPDGQYRALVARLVEESSPDGRVTVVMNRQDQARLGEPFLQQVSAELAARGRRVELVLAAEPGNMDGGVRLVGRDCEVDCTFERLLEQAAEALEPEVARALFG